MPSSTLPTHQTCLEWAYEYPTLLVAFRQGSRYLTQGQVDLQMQQNLTSVFNDEEHKTRAAMRMLRFNTVADIENLTQQSLHDMSENFAITDEAESTINQFCHGYPFLQSSWVGLRDSRIPFSCEVNNSNGLLINIPMNLTETYNSLVTPVDVSSQELWPGKKRMTAKQREKLESGKGVTLLCHLARKNGQNYELKCDLDMSGLESQETRTATAETTKHWISNTKLRMSTYWDKVWDDPDVDEAAILGALVANYSQVDPSAPGDNTIKPPRILTEALEMHLSGGDSLNWQVSKSEMESAAERYCNSSSRGRLLIHPFQQSRIFPSSAST